MFLEDELYQGCDRQKMKVYLVYIADVLSLTDL